MAPSLKDYVMLVWLIASKGMTRDYMTKVFTANMSLKFLSTLVEIDDQDLKFWEATSLHKKNGSSA